MAELKEVLVPDVGADAVDVIGILVEVGETVEAEQGLIEVEGDKASMEIPAPFGGTVKEIKIAVGDSVSQDSLIVILEAGGDAAEAPAPAAEPTPVTEAPAPAAEAPAPAAAAAVAEIKEVTVPDIGGDEVDVIAILAEVGETVEAEQGLIEVEGDKASMEVPAPFAGVIKEIKIAVGDKVAQGTLIALIETVSKAPAAAPAAASAAPAPAPAQAETVATPSAKPPPVDYHPGSNQKSNGAIHSSPAVRRLAREFGVDLSKVKGTGRKGRIVKEDVQAYVKYELSRPKAGAATASAGGGLSVLAQPRVDFSKFGEVEKVELSRIQKISGPNLHRNWVTIPHVTQFDEADITELEVFRKEQNTIAAKQELGYKVSPLAFVIKAAAKALEAYPKFNSSLDVDGDYLYMKKYIHIGVAVDTPNGLVVPVLRDVDKKGIVDISKELGEISKKARGGKLTSADMQGSCFTISSLGGIGGTQFTPIVNAPDVAILGVSKSEIKPKWNGSDFEPRLMVPLALSYDHRVIDGADGARFITTLNQVLSDIRRLVM